MEVKGNYETYLWNTSTGVFVITVTNNFNCSVTDTTVVIFKDCTFVTEINAAGMLEVFPSPTHGKLNISLNSGNAEVKKVEITSISGEIVMFSNDIKFPGEMDLSAFKKGVYFLQITVEKGTKITRKIILNYTFHKMKNNLLIYVLAFLIYLSGSTCNVRAQIYYQTKEGNKVIPTSDTIELKLQSHRGEVIWQFSYDSVNWKNVVGLNNDTQFLKVDSTGTYRAKITENTCNPVYSEMVYVNHPERGVLIDVEGNHYKTTKIGEQWWMAEDLRVTHYADGRKLNILASGTEWSQNEVTRPAAAYLNFDSTNKENVFYNFVATNESLDSKYQDVQGICPNGWHVPSVEEWTNLERNIGISTEEEYKEGNHLSVDLNKLQTKYSFNFGVPHYLTTARFYPNSLYYWTSTSKGDGNSRYYYFAFISQNRMRLASFGANYGYKDITGNFQLMNL